VAPVGIVYKSYRLNELVNAAREASISTHGGSLAIAAAAATAAAVSAAADCGSPADILTFATRAAAQAERRWPGGVPRFADAVTTVHESLRRLPALRPDDVAALYFPNGPLTIVPLALGIATLVQSAEEAMLLAANIGGDSDSVASIAGGILGARYPSTVNEGWYALVQHVNDFDLVAIANQLAALRH